MAAILPLRHITVLGNLGVVKAIFGRIQTVDVNSQHLGDCGQGVPAPVNFGAIRHFVLVAVLGGRVSQASFVEQLGAVVHRSREHGEGQAYLAFFGLVELHQGLVEDGGVVIGFFDERRQVKPLAIEVIRAAPTHRADDVGTIARGNFGGQSIASAVVGHNFKLEPDLILRGIEFVNHSALGGLLLGIGAGAQANEPADHDAVSRSRRLDLDGLDNFDFLLNLDGLDDFLLNLDGLDDFDCLRCAGCQQHAQHNKDSQNGQNSLTHVVLLARLLAYLFLKVVAWRCAGSQKSAPTFYTALILRIKLYVGGFATLRCNLLSRHLLARVLASFI